MQTYRIVRFSQSGRRRTTIEPGDLATPHVFKRWGRIFIASNHFGPITPDLVGRRVVEEGGVLQLENDEQYGRRTDASPNP